MKQKFFDLAKKLAKLSNHHSYKHGCVIVDKDKIVSVGTNLLKTHPKSNHPWNMVHAELAAILDHKFIDLKGCHAYVYRENLNGVIGNSKPCKYCEAVLKEAGIKKVFYTIENGYNEEKY